MDITDVKVVLKEGADKKLKAYATITFDNCFVVRNVKVIQGTKGLFVAMPSRKLKESCPKCRNKNPIRSKYCNQCGNTLPPPRPEPQANEKMRQSEHRDIAHPITLECRTYIQKKVLEAYEKENKNISPAIETRQEMPRAKHPASEPRAEEKSELDEEGDIQL